MQPCRHELLDASHLHLCRVVQRGLLVGSWCGRTCWHQGVLVPAVLLVRGLLQNLQEVPGGVGGLRGDWQLVDWGGGHELGVTKAAGVSRDDILDGGVVYGSQTNLHDAPTHP